jgi:hypothetical protein
VVGPAALLALVGLVVSFLGSCRLQTGWGALEIWNIGLDDRPVSVATGSFEPCGVHKWTAASIVNSCCLLLLRSVEFVSTNASDVLLYYQYLCILVARQAKCYKKIEQENYIIIIRTYSTSYLGDKASSGDQTCLDAQYERDDLNASS